MGSHTRIEVINGEPSDPSGKALVEPELAPPVHGDEVAEPLVSKLMSNDVCDTVTVAVGGGLLIKENGSSTT